jgi:tetratricopeptide (TPR) repeat protein
MFNLEEMEASLPECTPEARAELEPKIAQLRKIYEEWAAEHVPNASEVYDGIENIEALKSLDPQQSDATWFEGIRVNYEHIAAAESLAAPDYLRTDTLAWDYHQNEGRSIEAIEILINLREMYRTMQWDPTVRSAWTRPLSRAIAEIYDELGKYAEAIASLESEFESSDPSNGGDQREIAETLVELGRLYLAVGRYVEAERTLARALALAEAATPGDDLIDLIAFDQLRVCAETGRLDQAEPGFDRLRILWAASKGSDDPWTCTAMCTMAKVQNDMGRHAEAEALIKQIAKQEERSPSDEPLARAFSLGIWAEILRDTGRHNEAEAMYDRALAFLVAKLPPCRRARPSHPHSRPGPQP